MAHRIANAIRRLRFDAGEMTQKDLAAAVGVTRQTIMAIEAGKYSPSLELAFLIARAFAKPLDAVFTFDDPQNENPQNETPPNENPPQT